MNKLLLSLLGALIALPAFARDFTYKYGGKTLTYTVINEAAKTCSTKKGSNYSAGNKISGELIIPSVAKDGETEYRVTEIGDQSFAICTDLTSVTIPNSVTSIGGSAFFRCNSMSSLTIGNSVTSIGRAAFWECKLLLSVTIPNSVTSIGKGAFTWCGNLTELTIEDGTETLSFDYDEGSDVFGACPILTLYLGRNLSYEESPFEGLKNLSSVSIGKYVTEISKCLFQNCTNLSSVIIPESVTSIGKSAFCYCSGLTSVTIPESVTSIGNYAFDGCSGLASVTIPESVTSIGNCVFSGCSGLTSVTIGNSVKTIGDLAFRDCSGLTSVAIPNSVISIGRTAFYNCSGLISLAIGNSVKIIGEHAFSSCIGLKKISCDATVPPNAFETTFKEVDKSIPVYVPEQAVNAYKAAIAWKEFYNYNGVSGSEGLIVDIDAENEINNDAPIEVYNLSGIRVAESLENLAHGVYIVRQGDVVKKISVE